MTHRKAPGAVAAAPKGANPKPREGFKGRVSYITQRSRMRGARPSRVKARPSHPEASPVIALLNDRWRVIDDPLQWILEVRTGRPTRKATGWQGRAFCTQRSALIRCIGEYCGKVDPAALGIIKRLPKKHPDHENSSEVQADG